jgi:hypothetical protein
MATIMRNLLYRSILDTRVLRATHSIETELLFDRVCRLLEIDYKSCGNGEWIFNSKLIVA